MKKAIALLLIFAMLVPFVSCVKKKSENKVKVTVYGDGTVPGIVVVSSMPSAIVEEVMNVRGTLTEFLGSTPDYGTDKNEKTGMEIAFGNTNRAITERANRSLPALDGDDAAYVIYFDEDGAAVIWNNEYAGIAGVRYFSETYLTENVLKIAVGTVYVGHISVSEYSAELQREADEKKQQEEQERQEKEARAWAARFDVIQNAQVRAAVKDFYETFYDSEKIIRWWAGLYDPERGAFYYANSARDNDGFLPDMESTYQIVNRLRTFDSNLSRYLGPTITAKMIKFYQDMQDPSDGYFYHPQWTKAQSRQNNMRYTRDQNWALSVLDWLHSEPKYTPAKYRINSAGLYDEEVPRLLGSGSGWEANETSVRNYVNNLIDTTSCEHWGNQLDTQISNFEAAGVLQYVVDVLDERVNPTYGLWVTGYNESTGKYTNNAGGTEVPYGIYTNAYKVMNVYNAANRFFAHSTKMVENAIKAINSRDPGARVTYIFNPWATLGQVRTNLKNGGVKGTAALSAYDNLIKTNILGMIDALKSSLGIYRHADGSYSYLPNGCSAATIYSTPVSLGLNEGDVNANNLVISFSQHICNAIGLDSTIKVFSPANGRLMQELLNRAEENYKKGQSTATNNSGGSTASSGVTYDFTDVALNTLPGGASDNKKDGTTFKVVAEPGNTSNKVLEINKNTEGDLTGGQLSLPLQTVQSMTDSTVVEIGMRLKISDQTRFGTEISNKNNPNILQIGLMSGSSLFWMPTLAFNNTSSPSGYNFLVTKSTGGGYKEYPDNQSKTFQYDTWYDFTFRLTIKNYGKSNAVFKVEILVDGTSLGTSSCFYSDADASTATSGSINFATGQQVKIRFQPQMRIHALIYVDDITMTIK
ncbi:MAG: hypothetical protein J5958_03650 [Clostridia bacterium]|nr:hypothetical protein [Clostridia bacterium]